jgi:hypothetical protein
VLRTGRGLDIQKDPRLVIHFLSLRMMLRV